MTSDLIKNSQSPRRRPWQFGLRSVLIFSLVTATIFGAYRLGLDHGRRLGPLVPSNISATEIYSREYDVSDLITSDREADMLVTAIRTNVDANSWDVIGGYAEVFYFSQDRSLKVSHAWPGHVLLVKYLEIVRRSARGKLNFKDVLDEAKMNFAE